MKGKLLPLLLLLVIAAGGFYAYTEIEAKRMLIEELETKNAELTKEAGLLRARATEAEAFKDGTVAQLRELQKTNCKGVWSDEKGTCEEAPPVFSYPVGEETLCFGKTVDVKWDATLVNSATVEIMLATSSNAAKLASLKNQGKYSWKLQTPHKPTGATGSFTIAPGLYKLRIQSPEGHLLGQDTQLFDIKKCDEKKAKAPTRKKK